MIQIVSAENFALNRGTSEDYLTAYRDKMEFLVVLKNRYRIADDAGLNFILDTGILVTSDY